MGEVFWNQILNKLCWTSCTFADGITIVTFCCCWYRSLFDLLKLLVRFFWWLFMSAQTPTLTDTTGGWGALSLSLTHTCTRAHTHACENMHVHILLCLSTHTHTHTHTHMKTCMYVCYCAYARARAHTHTHTLSLSLSYTHTINKNTFIRVWLSQLLGGRPSV